MSRELESMIRMDPRHLEILYDSKYFDGSFGDRNGLTSNAKGNLRNARGGAGTETPHGTLMEPCVTSIASVCEVKVAGRSPAAVPGDSQTSHNTSGRNSHQQAMANAGLKTLVPSKEIREAVDPISGTHAQPAASRCLLSPQALAKPSVASFLGAPSVEFPRSAPSSSCCTLKRTFGSTNLLLLSLDDADDTAEEEEEEEAASPGPCLHSPCPKDNTEPIAAPLQPEHSSPPALSA
nr:uncharacterized protein LOC110360986 isoform X3 [Columba livia]